MQGPVHGLSPELVHGRSEAEAVGKSGGNLGTGGVLFVRENVRDDVA